MDDLPIPSVCLLLRDGWSRRASSSYSPFFDGEGAWSRSEAAGASAQEEEGKSAKPSTPPRGGEGSARGNEGVGRGGGGGSDGGSMPVPIATADVLIADLSFSIRQVGPGVLEKIDQGCGRTGPNTASILWFEVSALTTRPA